MKTTAPFKVGDLPIRAVPIIPARITIAGARKIAALKGTSLLFIERDGQLLGILDRTALAGAAEEVGVVEAMTPLPLCVSAAMPISRARELLVLTGAAALPVVAGAFLLGAVARVDVERALRSGRLPAGAVARVLRAAA